MYQYLHCCFRASFIQYLKTSKFTTSFILSIERALIENGYVGVLEEVCSIHILPCRCLRFSVPASPASLSMAGFMALLLRDLSLTNLYLKA